jgi:hypothetical protein
MFGKLVISSINLCELNGFKKTYLSVEDLKMTEFFEESIGVSKDNYILFNKDVVYKIINNKVEAVLKTKFSDDFTHCYYKKENVTFVKELPKTWESCNKKVGYIAFIGGNTRKFTDNIKAIMYATDKQALSSIAFAQLSQLVADMNGDWNYSWSKEPCLKYTIVRHRDELHLEDCRKYFKHLCFEKKEDAEFSLLHHKKLWEQMYEL